MNSWVRVPSASLLIRWCGGTTPGHQIFGGREFISAYPRGVCKICPSLSFKSIYPQSPQLSLSPLWLCSLFSNSIEGGWRKRSGPSTCTWRHSRLPAGEPSAGSSGLSLSQGPDGVTESPRADSPEELRRDHIQEPFSPQSAFTSSLWFSEKCLVSLTERWTELPHQLLSSSDDDSAIRTAFQTPRDCKWKPKTDSGSLHFILYLYVFFNMILTGCCIRLISASIMTSII